MIYFINNVVTGEPQAWIGISAYLCIEMRLNVHMLQQQYKEYRRTSIVYLIYIYLNK